MAGKLLDGIDSADDAMSALRAAAADELEQLAARLVKADFHQHTPDLNTALTSLQALITREYDVQSQISDLKQRIVQDGEERRRQRAQEGVKEGRTQKRAFRFPKSVSTTAELDELIQQLQRLRGELHCIQDFEVTIDSEQ